MRKTKFFRDRKGNDLVPYVLSKDGRHEVVAPLSSVRIGETDKNAVKSRQCVDYAKWVAIYVGRNEKDCKKWLDQYEEVVLRMCVPYEVSLP